MAEIQNRSLLSGREYIGVDKIDGALVFVSNTHPVGYRELIECLDMMNYRLLAGEKTKPIRRPPAGSTKL